MRKKKNKINFLSVHNDDSASRFVVNLNKEVEKNEAPKEEKLSFSERLLEYDLKGKIKSFKKSFHKKTEEYQEKPKENFKKSFKEFIESENESRKPEFTDSEDLQDDLDEFDLGELSQDKVSNTEKKESISDYFENKIESAKDWYSNNLAKYENLAFFSLFKFIFIAVGAVAVYFYKACFWTGWLFVFIIRFIYFLAMNVFLLVYEPIKEQVVKLKILVFIPKFVNYKIKYLNNSLIDKLSRQFDDIINNYKQIGTGIKNFFSSKRKDIKVSILNYKVNRQIKQDERLALKEEKRKQKETEKAEALALKEANLAMAKIREEEDVSGEEERPVLLDEDEKEEKDVEEAEDLEDIEEIEDSEQGLRPKIFSPVRVLKFALLLIVIIVPFKIYSYYESLNLEELKGKVLGVSESAFSNLGEASKSAMELDFGQAGDNFSEASNNFLEAQKELDNINDSLLALASLAPSEEMKLAAYSKKMISAGQAGSSLGENLSRALGSFFDEEEKKDKNFIELIDNFIYYAQKASGNARELEAQLEGIDPSVLPGEYQAQFIMLGDKVAVLGSGIDSFIDIVDKLKEFLGATQDKRYLLVFQNNTEMRASGGFIGSYALVDFSQGRIDNIEAPGGGSYDTEGGLQVLVKSPEPLQLVDPLWHFWDANWWPDWPTSARKLMWFYEKSDGPTVDGVISLTPTVLERILEVFGPIDMSEKYGIVVNSENFLSEVQEITEEKPAWREDGQDLDAEGNRLEPKKIIGDMLDQIIKELPNKINQENFINLISIIEGCLSEKHILFYFNDEELQNDIDSRGWSGRMEDTKWDYLSVINTNIAGGKSDKRIKETINHSAEIMPNGSVIDTIKIVRKHTGEKGEPFSGVRNVDWMRVYVPLGSELLEAQGFKRPDDIYFEDPDESWEDDIDVYRTETMSKTHEESGTKIYEENSKTVFANWSMVDPGESTTIYLKYKLPIVLEKKQEDASLKARIVKQINPDQKVLYPYALLIQKQPGSLGSQINSSLKLSDNFQIAWKYPKELNLISDGWKMADDLSIDKYWAILLEKAD